MKRILFSHSYFYKFDAKQWKAAEPYPPLMTITAAALLRENGFEVALFDVGLRDNSDELEGYLERLKPDYFVIFDDGFNYLTKMCLTTMREAAFGMQKMAKASHATVITCSSDSTDHYQKYFEHDADFVIKGEGELTLLDLINSLENGGETDHIPGLYFKKEGGIKLTAPRRVNRNLDQLPLAAWDLVDVDDYRCIWESRGKAFYLNLATTRGCPYKCNWCAKPIYGNRYNTRLPQKVVDEIAYHQTHHQVDHFWMCDDIFGLKPGWVQGFRDELIARGISIKYKIQSRADLLLQEDNIDALITSGLDEAWIGAESGSQRILDAMEKGTTIEQIESSTVLLKQKGVKVAYFIQFGYLGETMQEIGETIDLVLRMMPDKLGASVSYPLPGTKFYDMVKADLSKKSNWVDSDDLDMMFSNTYPAELYKRVHRYLHQRYNTKLRKLTLFEVLSNPLKLTFNRIKKIIALFLFYPFTIWNKYQIDRLSKVKNV